MIRNGKNNETYEMGVAYTTPIIIVSKVLSR